MKIERVSSGPDVGPCFDRMVEVMALLTPSSSGNAQIEYSAILGCGGMVMAASLGVEPSVANCSRILARVVKELVPILEAELRNK